MVALSQGGSADDIAPGVEFFRKLKEAGNFLPVDPTPATIESGQTPVVIDWNYTNASETKKLPSLAGRRPAGEPGRRLLLPGDQQGRPASRGRPAVAGVPLQRRGAEPLRRGRGAAGAGRQHDRRRHASTSTVAAALPVVDGPVDRADTAADRGGVEVPGGQLGRGGWLMRPGRRLGPETLPLLPFFAVVVIFLIVPTVTVIVSSVYARRGLLAGPDRGAVHRHRAVGVGQQRAAVGCHRAARCVPRRGDGVADRQQPTHLDGAPRGAVAVQRARPVRRCRTGIRVPGHDRAQRRADAVGAAGVRLRTWQARAGCTACPG